MQKIFDFYKKNKMDVLTGGAAAVIVGFLGVILLIGVGGSDSDAYKVENGSDLETTIEAVAEESGSFIEEDITGEKSSDMREGLLHIIEGIKNYIQLYL